MIESTTKTVTVWHYVTIYIFKQVKQGVEPETQTKRGNQSGNTCIKQNNQTPFPEGAWATNVVDV